MSWCAAWAFPCNVTGLTHIFLHLSQDLQLFSATRVFVVL
nr:MAG TPA: hypothetical protein [Caudoviricetes sp.]